jgi:hypothetical protein
MAPEEELKSEIERLRAEKEVLKQPGRGKIYLKVSEKGGLSVYGMGRFPVTLYREQWEKLLAMADDIRNFIRENESGLKKKERCRRTVPRSRLVRGAQSSANSHLRRVSLASSSLTLCGRWQDVGAMLRYVSKPANAQSFRIIRRHSHLMFFISGDSAKSWGAKERVTICASRLAHGPMERWLRRLATDLQEDH